MDLQIKEHRSTRASLELLYHISRELASALDLHTLLQRVLSLSMENVGATSGSVIVMDDTGQPIDSSINVGDKILQHTTQQLRATLEKGLAGWVVRYKKAVLIPDTSRDDRWLRRPDDAMDRTGAKSAMSAPLLARGELVGVMTLVHPTPGSFNESHLVLLETIADQAGIAVLNARLYDESQRRVRAMTAVAESAAAINESLQLDEVLLRILEQVSHALEVEIVSLALLDEKKEYLEFRASTLGAGESALGLRVPVGKGIAGWVVREGKGLIVPDVRADPRFYSDVDKTTGYETQSIACAPILSKGKVIGIIEAINPQQAVFESDDLLVLSGVGSLAGTAILHAQLFEQMQAAHKRYLELFEDSIDPILITDWKGQVLEANRQAEITAELDKVGLLALSVGQLHKIDSEMLGEDFRALASGETITYESILLTQQKREVPVQVYVREVDIDGKSHLQWILRDITERKNLDNLRNDLISMIYHDLRSPLANVVSSLDVMDTMLPEEDSASLRSLMGIAMRSTERIMRLTNSLLDINRLEAGQPVVNLQPTDPSVVAREAVEAIAPIAGNKGQQLTTEVPADLPRVMIDADMIRRVLANLMENAVKFTPPEGKISVGARVQERWIQMWVQDDGAGIPEAERERIFDKYTRLHAKDGPRGIGLGLAYCRLAVEGHGGRIWVEGEQGAGARFCFTLPIADG